MRVRRPDWRREFRAFSHEVDLSERRAERFLKENWWDIRVQPPGLGGAQVIFSRLVGQSNIGDYAESHYTQVAVPFLSVGVGRSVLVHSSEAHAAYESIIGFSLGVGFPRSKRRLKKLGHCLSHLRRVGYPNKKLKRWPFRLIRQRANEEQLSSIHLAALGTAAVYPEGRVVHVFHKGFPLSSACYTWANHCRKVGPQIPEHGLSYDLMVSPDGFAFKSPWSGGELIEYHRRRDSLLREFPAPKEG